MRLIHFKGYDCLVQKRQYDNGRPALQLIDAEDGSPIAKATVNLPDVPLGRNQVPSRTTPRTRGCWTPSSRQASSNRPARRSEPATSRCRSASFSRPFGRRLRSISWPSGRGQGAGEVGMTEAFPLHWPAGRPQTAILSGVASTSPSLWLATACSREIRMLGGTLPVLSTNIPLRKDGLPYANHRQPEDKGVAVYFTLNGNPMCFACDRWDSVADNVQAIQRRSRRPRYRTLGQRLYGRAGVHGLRGAARNVAHGEILGVAQLPHESRSKRRIVRKAGGTPGQGRHHEAMTGRTWRGTRPSTRAG